MYEGKPIDSVSGKPIDSVSGKPISEKGMVSGVVKDLVGPFEGFNHVASLHGQFFQQWSSC